MTSVGVLLAMFVGVHMRVPHDGSLLVLSLCFVLIAWKQARRIGLLCALFAGLLLGTWRIGVFNQEQEILQKYIGKTVVIEGRVSDDPTLGIEGDTRIRIAVSMINEAEVPSAELWVSLNDDVELKRSDKIRISGLLSGGFGPFSAVMYRADIVAVTREAYADVARDVRDRFAESVRTGIDEPEGSLAVGFLLGQKSELPEKLQQELRLLGLTHIVVASGYNLTLLVRFARRFFMRVSRFTALSASGLLVYFFTQMTGFTPSMSRASLIAGLSLVAWYFGRVIHPFVLIPFSAAITILVKPMYATGDIGWLLSFGSFIGVIVLAPLIHSYFWGDHAPKTIRQLCVETISAQLVTFPIVLLAFGMISPLSLPANMLVVPLIPFIMLFSFFTGVAGIFSASLATIIGFPAQILLNYITWVVERLSLYPIASRTVEVGPEVVVIVYLLLLVATLFMWRRSGHQFHKVNVIE